MEKLKQMKEALVGCVQGQVYSNLKDVDAKELGAAIDMIKDLSEAIYYCTITEAMEEGEEEGSEKKGKHGMMYYNQRMQPMYHMPYPYPIEYYDPRYRERYSTGSMYAQGGNSSSSGSSNGGNSGSSNSGGNNARGGGTRGYHEGMMPMYEDGMMYNPNYTMYERGGMQGGGNRNYQEMMRDPREGRSGERRKMYMEGKQMGKEKSKQMQELEGYMQELTHDLTEMIQDASPEEKQLLQQKISTLATKIK